MRIRVAILDIYNEWLPNTKEIFTGQNKVFLLV